MKEKIKNCLSYEVGYEHKGAVKIDIFDQLFYSGLKTGCPYLKISSGGYGGEESYHDCARGGECSRYTCAVLRDIITILNNRRSDYWKFVDNTIQEWSPKEWIKIAKAYAGIKKEEEK